MNLKKYELINFTFILLVTMAQAGAHYTNDGK